MSAKAGRAICNIREDRRSTLTGSRLCATAECGPQHCFVRVSGHDLAAFEDLFFDFVLAVDRFPYLAQVGLAEQHLHDFRRVLKTDGACLILDECYKVGEREVATLVSGVCAGRIGRAS